MNKHQLAHAAQISVLDEAIKGLEAIKNKEMTLQEVLDYFNNRKKLVSQECDSCALVLMLEDKIE